MCSFLVKPNSRAGVFLAISGLEGVEGQAETIRVSPVTPAVRLFSAGLLPAGPVFGCFPVWCWVPWVPSLPKLRAGWLAGNLWAAVLLVLSNPRRQLRARCPVSVVPGLCRCSASSSGAASGFYDFDCLVIISDATVDSTMWNFLFVSFSVFQDRVSL